MKRALRPLARRDLATRIAGYSATALAALAAAPGAHATVQNITALTLDGNATGPLVVNFQASATNHSVGLVGLGNFQLQVVNNSNTGGVWVQGNTNMMFSTRASNLPAGAPLNPAYHNFNAGQEVLALYTQRSSRREGNFRFGGGGQTTGYLDFKAIRSGHSYIGWLRVQVQNSNRGFANQFALIAKDGAPGIFGAYDLAGSVVSDNFTAGSVAVPEPSVAALSGLSLLALGATGVRELRRRRQASMVA